MSSVANNISFLFCGINHLSIAKLKIHLSDIKTKAVSWIQIVSESESYRTLTA